MNLWCVGNAPGYKEFQEGCKYDVCDGYFDNKTWDKDMNSKWVMENSKDVSGISTKSARCLDAPRRGHDMNIWCTGDDAVYKEFQEGCKAVCHVRGLFSPQDRKG